MEVLKMNNIMIGITSLTLPPGVDFSGIFNDLMAVSFPFVTFAVVFMAVAVIVGCIKFARRSR
jgi:hypothetical protein